MRRDATLDMLGDTITRMLGRTVGIERTLSSSALGPYSATLTAVQRCRACGVEIASRVAESPSMMEMLARLGAAARKAYLVHACERAESALVGFTWTELEELYQTLERDIVRLAERAEQIHELWKARQQ